MSKTEIGFNVLHLISSLEVGGAEKLLIDLLKAESEFKFTVVVMNDRVDENLKKEIIDTGHKIYFLNRGQSSKNPKYLATLLNIIIKNKIDIIHSHNFGSKSWSMLCKILMPKLKLVFTVHDTNIFDNLNWWDKFFHRIFIDKNIVISKAVLKDVQNSGIKKISLIYNGIDINKFCMDNKKEENYLFNIVNISRVNHLKKGQDVLIKALKICKDKGLRFKCDFVGGIYDYCQESFSYLQSLVIELQLEQEINFLGARDDVPKLLAQADLFILPSRYEGLGLVVLESMASGVPVIASNIDGPAELISNGQNGLLFESENHIDLADKIMDLYNNKEKSEELVHNAGEYVQNFDISIMRKKYYELYMECT